MEIDSKISESVPYKRLVGLHHLGQITLVREAKQLAYPAQLSADVNAQAADYAVYGPASQIDLLERAGALNSRARASQGLHAKAYLRHTLVEQFIKAKQESDRARTRGESFNGMLDERNVFGDVPQDQTLFALKAMERPGVTVGMVRGRDASSPHYLVISARQEGDVAEDRDRLSDKSFELMVPQMGNEAGGVLAILPVRQEIADALQRHHETMLDLSAQMADLPPLQDRAIEMYALAGKLHLLPELRYTRAVKSNPVPVRKEKPVRETINAAQPLDIFLDRLMPEVKRLQLHHRLGRTPQLRIRTNPERSSQLIHHMANSRYCLQPITWSAHGSSRNDFTVEGEFAIRRILEHAAHHDIAVAVTFPEIDYRSLMDQRHVVYNKNSVLPSGQITPSRTNRDESVRGSWIATVNNVVHDSTASTPQQQHYLYLSADSIVRAQLFLSDAHVGQHFAITGRGMIPAVVRVPITPEMATHLHDHYGIAQDVQYSTAELADQGARIRAGVKRANSGQHAEVAPARAIKASRDPRRDAAAAIFGQAVRRRIILEPNRERGRRPSLRKVRVGLQVHANQSEAFQRLMTASGWLTKERKLIWLERIEGEPHTDIFVLQMSGADAQAWQHQLAAHRPHNHVMQVSENSMTEAKAVILERLHDTLPSIKTPEEIAWKTLVRQSSEGTLQSLRIVCSSAEYADYIGRLSAQVDALRALGNHQHAARALADQCGGAVLQFDPAFEPDRIPKGLANFAQGSQALIQHAGMIDHELQCMRQWMQHRRRDAYGNAMIDCLVYEDGKVPATHFDVLAASDQRERDEQLAGLQRKGRPYSSVRTPYFSGEALRVKTDGDTAIVLRPVSEEFIHRLRRLGADLASPHTHTVSFTDLPKHVSSLWSKAETKKEDAPKIVNMVREGARANVTMRKFDPCRELVTVGAVHLPQYGIRPAIAFTVHSKKQWKAVQELLHEMHRGEWLATHTEIAEVALPSYSELQQQALTQIAQKKERLSSIHRMLAPFDDAMLFQELEDLAQGRHRPLLSTTWRTTLAEIHAVLATEEDTSALPTLGLIREVLDTQGDVAPFVHGLKESMQSFIREKRVEAAELDDAIVALRARGQITDRDIANQVSKRQRDGVHYFCANQDLALPELQDIRRAIDKHFQLKNGERSETPFRFGVFLNLPSLEIDKLQTSTDEALVKKLTQSVPVRGQYTQREAARRRPATYPNTTAMLNAMGRAWQVGV